MGTGDARRQKHVERLWKSLRHVHSSAFSSIARVFPTKKNSSHLKVRTLSLTSTNKFVERSHALPCPETDRGGTRHPASPLESRSQHRACRDGCGLGGAGHGLHLGAEVTAEHAR